MSVQYILRGARYQTTYNEGYRHHRAAPPVGNHQLPALLIIKLEPSQFPDIQRKLYRRVAPINELCIGLGPMDIATEKYFLKVAALQYTRTHKIANITQSVPSLLQKEESTHENVHLLTTLFDGTGDDNYTEEVEVEEEEENGKERPSNIVHEDKADMVTYRPLKYEDSPGIWQKEGAAWDRKQRRQPTGMPINNSEKVSSKLRQLRTKMAQTVLVQYTSPKIYVPQVFCRPNTSFSGFVPMSPVEVTTTLDQSLRNGPMSTTMKSCYRRMPGDEYREQEHAHKGPLSRSVTRTWPYNPYNKIDSRYHIKY